MLPFTNLHSQQSIRLNIDSRDINIDNQPIDIVSRLSKWKNWPWITLIINISLWSAFLIAMVISSGKSRKYPNVFPSNPNWWYYEVVSWPQCQDVRGQIWRVISYLFVHDGYMHIFGNTICAIGYGSILEIYHPMSSSFVFLSFFLTGVIGALGYSVFWPYSGLIGASPAVYGWLGGCIVLLIWYRQLMELKIQLVLAFLILFQLCYDIINYILSYSSEIGYVAHAFGLISGIFFALLFSGFIDKKISSVVMTITSIISLGFITGYLLYNEIINYPPNPYQNSFFHNTNPGRYCCYEFLEFLEDHPEYTRQKLHKISECTANGLEIFG